MKKIFTLFFFFALLGFTYTNAQQWTTVGSANFTTAYASSPSLAFNSAGDPYVAFSDGANGGKLTVMKYTGGSWQILGSAGVSAGSVSSVSMAVSQNVVLVAFADAANSGKATVMRYNGASWTNVGGAGFTPGAAYYTSLGLDSSGYPYVAFSDANASNKASVMHLNNSNSWVNLGNAGFSNQANYVTMAFYHNTPYVAYADGGQGYAASVMAYNGSSWVQTGNAGFTGVITAVSIATNSNGTPYVASANNGGAVNTLNNNTWAAVGSGFSGAVSAIDMAIDGNNVPYVFYPDNANGSKARCEKYSNSSWADVGTPGFSPGKIYSPVIAIGNGNIPYVAYLDYTDSNKITVMAYGTPTTGIQDVETAPLHIYPNPAHNEINLENATGLSRINIYNLSGQVVATYSQQALNKINVKELSPGMYILEATGAQGTIYRHKILKD